MSASRHEPDIADRAGPEFFLESPDEFRSHHLEVMAQRGVGDAHQEYAATQGIGVGVPGVEFADKPGPERLDLGLPIPLLELQFLEEATKDDLRCFRLPAGPLAVWADPAQLAEIVLCG